MNFSTTTWSRQCASGLSPLSPSLSALSPSLLPLSLETLSRDSLDSRETLLSLFLLSALSLDSLRLSLSSLWRLFSQGETLLSRLSAMESLSQHSLCQGSGCSRQRCLLATATTAVEGTALTRSGSGRSSCCCGGVCCFVFVCLRGVVAVALAIVSAAASAVPENDGKQKVWGSSGFRELSSRVSPFLLFLLVLSFYCGCGCGCGCADAKLRAMSLRMLSAAAWPVCSGFRRTALRVRGSHARAVHRVKFPAAGQCLKRCFSSDEKSQQLGALLGSMTPEDQERLRSMLTTDESGETRCVLHA